MNGLHEHGVEGKAAGVDGDLSLSGAVGGGQDADCDDVVVGSASDREFAGGVQRGITGEQQPGFQDVS
ncbi:MAG: hypothetical protein ACK5L2_22035, partial [Planctomyces sp.]